MPDAGAAEMADDKSLDFRPYDFQRHAAMDRGRLRRLSPLLEVAAHRITQALTGLVRASVRVEVGELSQKTWEAYANALPEPTYIAFATINPIGGRLSIHMPTTLARAIVELRLGGTVRSTVIERQLSDIEVRLLAEVTGSLIDEFLQAASVVVPMASGPVSTSSSPVLVQMPDPSEVCLIVKLSVTLEEKTTFEVTVTVPLVMLMTLLDALERIENPEEMEQNSVASDVLERLLEAPLQVTVSFPDVVLSADELLSLSAGDAIPLQQPEGTPVHLKVEGVHFCDVVATTSGKRLACLVVDTKSKETH